MTAPIMSAADWSARTNASWRKSFDSMLETGRLIRAAKAALPHGEFLAMVETALPFKPRYAQLLMKTRRAWQRGNSFLQSLFGPLFGSVKQ